MTRETKIGLLVGLAFIIVIGILLSDHLTNSTDPPAATLAQTGNNVRQQVTTPGGTQAPITPTVQAPAVTPQAPVPTIRELQPQTPATAIVQVGGPAAQQPQQSQQPVVMQSTQEQPPITVVGNDPNQRPPQTAPQQQQPRQLAGADAPDRVTPVPGNLAQIAQQHGETLVTITPDGQQRPMQSGPAIAQQQQAPQPTGYRDYVVQSGDSVSKLASRF